MKIILLEDIKGGGKKDQVIEVAQGYGMNFLIPNKKGVLATNENLEKLKRKQEKQNYDRGQEIILAKEIKEQLEKVTLVIEAKVGEKDKLFGTITPKEIVEELEKKYNIVIDKKKVNIKNPIKQTGEYIVNIKLDKEVNSNLKVVVIGIK